MPENWDALKLYLTCRHQWRFTVTGVPAGLDYASCRAAAKGAGIPWQKAFKGLAALERHLLAGWKKRKK